MCIYDWMVRRAAVLTLLCCCLSGPKAVAAEKTSSYYGALESIRVDQLQTHVDHLASDGLKGREAGRPGGQVAGNYLRDQLQALQLQAADRNGDYFQPFGKNYRNVLARIEGSDPVLSRQVILVGAHYDHVGMGNQYNSRGPTGQIHNGADDNASGTSGLLELVEALAMLPEPPKRTILFAFWDAEEEGMLGSKHWASRPTVALDRVDAVLNLDMIGRLRDDKLTVFGSRSGFGWRRLVSRQNEQIGLTLDFSWSLQEQSDHSTFIERDIPVLMLHTGIHDDYHSPRDDAHLINHQGMSQVVQLLFGIAYELADRAETPDFRAVATRENEARRKQLAERKPLVAARLGVNWEQGSSPEGVLLTFIEPGSAAEKANLKVGDRIERVAAWEVETGEQLTGAVVTSQSPVNMMVRRADGIESEELSVPLDGKRMRLGLTWRVDDAEPGTIILTHVVPGSPAARAGLEVGDRIYQIAGEDFADDAEFAQQAKAHLGPMELTVERDGQIRTTVLHFTPQPGRAA